MYTIYYPDVANVSLSYLCPPRCPLSLGPANAGLEVLKCVNDLSFGCRLIYYLLVQLCSETIVE